MTRPSPVVPASLPSSCLVSRGEAQVSPINGSCRSPRSGGLLSCPIFFPHQISTARSHDALAGQGCVTSSSPRRSCPHEALGWRGGWLPRGKPRGVEIPSKCLHPPSRAESSLEAQSRGTPRFSGTPSSEPFLPSCPDQEGRRGSEEVLPENFGPVTSLQRRKLGPAVGCWEHGRAGKEVSQGRLAPSPPSSTCWKEGRS